MPNKRKSFGTERITILDKFGIWLTKIKIRKNLPIKNVNVLELGSGFYALNLLSIYENCNSITAVDFNLSKKLENFEKITLIESSIDKSLDILKNKKFDVIMILNVLEHLNNPSEVLSKCYRLLNKGGKLITLVPTWRGKFFLELAAFKFNLAPREEMNDHKMYYDLKDFWPLTVHAGFKPENIVLTKYKFGLTLFGVLKK